MILPSNAIPQCYNSSSPSNLLILAFSPQSFFLKEKNKTSLPASSRPAHTSHLSLV